MRATIAATLMIVVTAASAQAQPTGTVGRAKPKPAATNPTPPAAQSPADTAKAMALGERQAIQSDLAWVGTYNGVINGEVNDRLIAAIKTFQKDHRDKQTGVLNPQERVLLTEAAKKLQANVGWKIVIDAGSGARLGLPTKLVPRQTSDANGAKWSSSTGTIQILLTRRKEAGSSSATFADQEKKEPADRKIEYSAVKPDFFVLSGTQGLKRFYVRGQFKGSEARILTVLYDQATEGTMEPVVIVMSSAFNPFPAGVLARRSVDYGTGVVVSGDGAIVTGGDVVDACQSIVVGGLGRADKVAEDKDRGLALLRVYGAPALKPLALAGSSAASSVELVGIADPQNQGGGNAVSRVKAAVMQTGSGGELALSPSPALGFSGAAAIDANGKFAGLALLKPVVVAGPSSSAPAAQAVLVNTDTVQAFLKANKVTPANGSTDPKASVVRVICVRK